MIQDILTVKIERNIYVNEEKAVSEIQILINKTFLLFSHHELLMSFIKLFTQLWIRVFSKSGLHSCRSMVNTIFWAEKYPEVPTFSHTFGVEDFIKIHQFNEPTSSTCDQAFLIIAFERDLTNADFRFYSLFFHYQRCTKE